MERMTKGSCNCGAMQWQAKGEMREIVACHCSQCRKQTGLYYAATNIANDRLTIKGETLKWYKSSDGAERGFCSECGSALFWRRKDSDTTSILAGSIDGDCGLEIGQHIFVADKPDWYDINDGKPQREHG